MATGKGHNGGTWGDSGERREKMGRVEGERGDAGVLDWTRPRRPPARKVITCHRRRRHHRHPSMAALLQGLTRVNWTGVVSKTQAQNAPRSVSEGAAAGAERIFEEKAEKRALDLSLFDIDVNDDVSWVRLYDGLTDIMTNTAEAVFGRRRPFKRKSGTTALTDLNESYSGMTRDPSSGYSRSKARTRDPPFTRLVFTRESNKSSTRDSGEYSLAIRIANESKILARHIACIHLTQSPFMPDEHPRAIARGHSAVHEAGTEGGGGDGGDGGSDTSSQYRPPSSAVQSSLSSSAAVAETAAAGSAWCQAKDPAPGMQPRSKHTPQRPPDNRQSGRGDNRRTLGGGSDGTKQVK
ncbi:hypothetical protein BDZ89DRAFT_1117045 [Hymenopellis radicata]|nr:hypothetical protein BDZ89DRAFT_1117045 [Hymenopellis radicata]